ncbi:MAG TPA: MBL fold metallo-hydrolase [Amycolatopsis sp.]|nr:MBL fold metallo-hydrolase [Amycolatopsis sp.]
MDSAPRSTRRRPPFVVGLHEIKVGDLTLRVLHTPGHAPGAC